MAFSKLMSIGIQWFVIALGVLSLRAVASAHTGPTHNKEVFCYLDAAAVYRPGYGSYSIDRFDPNLCTHAVYLYAALDMEQLTIKSLDQWLDLRDDNGLGGFEHLTGMKKTYPHLKVSLGIGGTWNDDSKDLSIVSSDYLKRKRFVMKVTSFIRKYNFDGLEIFWQYPTMRGGQRRDRENFVLLAKKFREEFDTYNLLLIVFISERKNIIDKSFDVRQLSQYSDFLHVGSHSYHDGWDKKVGFNAPLTASDELNVQYTIEYLLLLGANPSKLLLGVPLYGRSFNTQFEANIGDEISGTGFADPFIRDEDVLGYNEICLMLSDKSLDWTRTWDVNAAEVIARSPRHTTADLFRLVTFDSSRSIANKVMFALRKSLAGIAAWSVDTDDFLGHCELDNDTFTDYELLIGNSYWLNGGNVMLPKRVNSKYPLLRTINEAFLYAFEEIEMEQQLKQKKEQQLRNQQKKPVEQSLGNEVPRALCTMTIPRRCFPSIVK